MRTPGLTPCLAAATCLFLVLTCPAARPQSKPGKTATAPAPASPNARLLKAILRQDGDAVRDLIAKGADPNAREAGGDHRPALAVAASLANEPIVRLLLDHGAKLTGSGLPRTVPLQAAMEAIDLLHAPTAVDVIRLLLERGADPNLTWGDMSTGEWAISNDHLDVLALMLKHGLKVNAVSINHMTPLEAAVEWDKSAAIGMLVDAGANPNVLNSNGSSLCATAKNEGARKALRAAGGKEILVELPKDVDLSTPQNTVESFAKAINRADVKAMAICVSLARPHEPLTRADWLAKAIEGDGIRVRFAVSELQVKDDRATCIVETQPETRDGSALQLPVRLLEPIEFVRESGRWRIWPYDFLAGNYEGDVSVANEMADDLDPRKPVDRPGTIRRLSPKQLLDAIECRIRMSILALQVLRFAEAHQGALAITDAAMLKKVCGKYDPELIGQCAARDAPPARFHFNDALANAKLATIKDPPRTILLYEGSAGKPEFRHSGQVMVAFANGFCWLVDRKALAAKEWRPK